MTLTGNPGWRLKRHGYKQIKGEHYGTPKEVWGFRTKASGDAPRRVAHDFLLTNAELFQLEAGLSGLEVQRVIRSLGATHVILRQVHARRRVYRGYVSVHMDRSGRVFLTKNRAVPAKLLPTAFEKRIDRNEAVRRARGCLPRMGRPSALRETEQLWFPREDQLVPAWKVRLTREGPREEWIIYLSARNGAILSRYDNLAQAPSGRKSSQQGKSPRKAAGARSCESWQVTFQRPASLQGRSQWPTLPLTPSRAQSASW